jgi:hypothetical protein
VDKFTVGFSEGRACVSGGARELKSGATREVLQGVTAFVHNF